MAQTVLVVDDDREIARLVRAYLEQAGFRALCAHNGATALRTIRTELIEQGLGYAYAGLERTVDIPYRTARSLFRPAANSDPHPRRPRRSPRRSQPVGSAPAT